VTLSRRQRQALAHDLPTAQRSGPWHDVTGLLAILAVTEGQNCDQVALTLWVTLKIVPQWVRRVLVAGPIGVPRTKPPERPATLTTTLKQALAKLIDAGPVLAGFASPGWRSPRLQPLIYERCGVFYHVFYSAPVAQASRPLDGLPIAELFAG
jgi:transposase